MNAFHRLRKSDDPKLPEWRLRVSADCSHEMDIVEETVHAEQINNPEARHHKRRSIVRVTREEAVWLRDALTAWLEERPDGGKPCVRWALSEEACRG